jgi:hypothetical protein
VTIGRKIDVLGGLGVGDVSTPAVVTINLAAGRATPSGLLARAVHDAAGVALGPTAYVFAGGAATAVSAVQAFSGGSTSIVGSLPSGRSDLAATVVGGTAYIVGGFDGTQLVPEILATRDGTHFRTVGHLVQPVRYPAIATAGGAVIVVGGALATTEGTLAGAQTSDIQRFDPATGVTTVIGHLPVILSHAMAVVLGGQLFALGGRSGSALSAHIWRIDPKTGRVTAAGTFANPRSDAGVAVVGDQAYLIGGETSGPLAPLDTVVALRRTP